MRPIAIFLAIVLSSQISSVANAQRVAGRHYPRVYGPSGSLYGPTQAHYQYQRKYGRAWHGSSVPLRRYSSYSRYSSLYGAHYGSHSYGSHSYFSHGHIHPLAPTYFGHIGAYSGYGYNTPYYSYRPPQPVIIVSPPVVYDSRVAAPLIVRNPAPPVVFNNRVIQQALRENEQRWGNQIVVRPEIKLVKRPITPSSPQARLRGVNLQAKGDQWMRQQKYVHAYSRYKQALKQTPDLPVAHFRVGFALVATGRYSLAVAHFKRGLEIDPRWPSKGESLIEIYGVNNELAKMGFVRKAADWTREDVRDPERLFLMGLLLFFDNNPSQAAPFFETALRLRGSGEHLLAFLELGQGNQNNKKPPQAKKPAPQNVNPLNVPPPAPEPVPQTNE